MRHAAALPSRKLKRVFKVAGQQSSGFRTELIQRVAGWLGPQYAEQEEGRKAALKLRQKQSEQHRDVPFCDVDRYHNSKPGESRFIVDQLLMQLGPVASWATEQLDKDAGGQGARCLGDNVLVHNNPSGAELVVVSLSKRELCCDSCMRNLAITPPTQRLRFSTDTTGRNCARMSIVSRRLSNVQGEPTAGGAQPQDVACTCL
jgi:hypothetical protein